MEILNDGFLEGLSRSVGLGVPVAGQTHEMQVTWEVCDLVEERISFYIFHLHP